MIKLLKKYKKLIIMLSFAYIYMLVIFTVPSGYTLITPGEINNIDNVYNIEAVEFNDNFNTVSVYSWHELTVFQKWATDKSKIYSQQPQTTYEKSLSLADVNKQGIISKQSSHEQAVIVAYEKASELNNEINIDYKFEGLIIYNNYNKFTKIGDLVIGINDTTINEVPNYRDFLLLAYDENPNKPGHYNLKQNMKLQLKDGTTITTDYKDEELMSFMPKFDILETTPQYTQKEDRRNIGGPSGGAIQSLAIYSALLNYKFNNLKIAGTGTIDLYNYKVGNIGGLIQKLHTVIDNKVNHFFVPKEQYESNKALFNKITNNKSIIVHPVTTFDEMVTIIEGLANNV